MLVSFAFGELDTGRWGVGWFPDGERGTVTAEGEPTPAALSIEEHDTAAWQASFDGRELILKPAGQAISHADGGFDQLCRVRPQPGSEPGVLGWRQRRPVPTDGSWSSLRQAAAWFESEEGVALTALRPGVDSPHGEDRLTAAVLGGDQAGPVEDPRLSTTYDEHGRPSRSSIELWLPGEDEDEVIPLRAAGEPAGPHAGWQENGGGVSVQLFRWHSRGREGAGAFLLAHRG